jgi:ribosomal protein L36
MSGTNKMGARAPVFGFLVVASDHAQGVGARQSGFVARARTSDCHVVRRGGRLAMTTVRPVWTARNDVTLKLSGM